MPGSRALAVLSLWFDPQCVSTVFEPLIADWQREWDGAEGVRRVHVWIRGAIALFISIIATSPNVLFAASPAGTMRRVLIRLSIWTTVVTALLVVPFVNQVQRQLEVGIGLYVLVLLLPQAIALALPFAIATVVDVIRSAPSPTRGERITTVRVALAACVVLFVVDGWVYPAANQGFRVAMTRAAMGDNFRRGPAPGRNELSLVELTRYSLEPRPGDSLNRDYAVRELNRRLALILIPLFFMWSRWRALLLPRGHYYSAAPLKFSVPVMLLFWYSLMMNRAVADAFHAPAWAAPWLVYAVMAVSVLGVNRVRRRAAGLA